LNDWEHYVVPVSDALSLVWIDSSRYILESHYYPVISLRMKSTPKFRLFSIRSSGHLSQLGVFVHTIFFVGMYHILLPCPAWPMRTEVPARERISVNLGRMDASQLKKQKWKIVGHHMFEVSWTWSAWLWHTGKNFLSLVEFLRNNQFGKSSIQIIM
jgi:hypothetical protein